MIDASIMLVTFATAIIAARVVDRIAIVAALHPAHSGAIQRAMTAYWRTAAAITRMWKIS